MKKTEAKTIARKRTWRSSSFRDWKSTEETFITFHSKRSRKNLATTPFLQDVEQIVKQMKSNSALGVCGIPVDVLKEAGIKRQSCLHALICRVQDGEQLPDDLKNAQIVTTFKNRVRCNNFRGMALLFSTRKTLARVVLNRLL